MLGAGLLQWVMTSISFARHQFPPDVIRHAVWLYLRFTLSYRDVEEMLAERGLDLTYETVRRWAAKFGPLFARELRKRRHRPTGRWHLDERVVKIAGKRHWLWRAVDDEGRCSTSLRNHSGIPEQPFGSCASSSRSRVLRPRCWSLTGWAHTEAMSQEPAASAPVRYDPRP